MKVHNIDIQTLNNYVRPGYNIIFKAGSEWFNKVSVGDKITLFNGSVPLVAEREVETIVTIPFWKVRDTEIPLNIQELSREDLRAKLIKEQGPEFAPIYNDLTNTWESMDISSYGQLIVTMILIKV